MGRGVLPFALRGKSAVVVPVDAAQRGKPQLGGKCAAAEPLPFRGDAVPGDLVVGDPRPGFEALSAQALDVVDLR